jgi:four helix bundle protein
MFIKLKHKGLGVYLAVTDLVKEVYKLSVLLPSDEKFNMVQQIRRAALSVKLNLAEGRTRRSAVERKRYLVVARGSVVEIEAVLEVAVDLNYIKKESLEIIGELLNKCIAMLSKKIG